MQSKHIWNCAETNIQLEHKPTSVVRRKGGRVPGRVANSKDSVSVLGCGNAECLSKHGHLPSLGEHWLVVLYQHPQAIPEEAFIAGSS